MGQRVGQGPFVAGPAPGQEADFRVPLPETGNLLRQDLPVFGIGEFLPGRKVDPELKAAHAPFGLLGHLGVDDASGGLHPLGPSGDEISLVSHAVPVKHVAFEQIGEGHEAAVRMVGEARDVVIGPVAVEVVEHQEGIQGPKGRGSDGAVDGDAGPLGETGCLDEAKGGGHAPPSTSMFWASASLRASRRI